MMDKEQFAKMITGREYLEEISESEELIAKKNGLVVAFGMSDDNCEFRGAIREEIPCWEGKEIYFSKSGNNFCGEDGKSFLTYHNGGLDKCKNMIKAVWCDKNSEFSWTYKTSIPHAKFEIYEGDEYFCEGIVFSVNDLK